MINPKIFWEGGLLFLLSTLPQSQNGKFDKVEEASS